MGLTSGTLSTTPDNYNTTPVAPPNVLGSVTNLMQLQALKSRVQTDQVNAASASQTFQDQQDVRQALADNVATDPATGKPAGVNTGKAVQDLYQRNPSAAMSLTAQLAKVQQEQAEAQKTQIANHIAINSEASDYLSSIHDQASLDQVRSVAQNSPELKPYVDKLPSTYEEAAPLIKTMSETAISTKDKLDLVARNKGLFQESTKNTQEAANRLGQDYMKDDQSQEFQKISTAATQGYTALQQASKALQTGGEVGPADMALLTALAKMENPNISPRLGIIDATTDVRSLSSALQAQIGEVLSGTKLSPAQRQAASDLMSSRLEQSRLAQIRTDARYKGMAVAQGVVPAMAGLDDDSKLSNPNVVTNPFSNKAADAAANSPKTKLPALTEPTPAPKAPAAQPNAPQTNSPAPGKITRTTTAAKLQAAATRNGITLDEMKRRAAINGIQITE